MIIFLVLVYSFAIATFAGADFNLNLHSIEDGSRCLDGSQSAIYTSEGVQKDKVLIFFQGGGSCEGLNLTATLANCYLRSKTSLGSSKNYPKLRNFDDYSFLSPLKSINPLFYNWTKAFIPYCDGGLHQGTRRQPIPVKNTLLYFRGHNNTVAHFNFLNQKFSLFDATNIVIAGSSAGGIATLIWGNYVYHSSRNKNGILLIPDSGIFVTDFINPFTNKTPGLDYKNSLHQIINTEIAMPLSQCVAQYPSQKQCFKGGNLPQFLLPAVFIIQSQYDAWGIGQILQLNCAPNIKPSNLLKCNESQKSAIESYRKELLQSFKNFTNFKRNGIWAISCVQHGFLQNSVFIHSNKYLIPHTQGITIYKALINFIIKLGQKINIDTVQWPYNLGCNGTQI